ncbi:hypothetical protein [Nocardia blacklockiae]|uniref:hypothetical protein n=1 Tax=Nocardia blacklockiae TaxID=480036 RepID=UPI001894453C|nr:hypothetical protein [Nocardia blacklockiae]MBF6172111.1 hypothetical protein [Nocardia blacklockiae]
MYVLRKLVWVLAMTAAVVSVIMFFVGFVPIVIGIVDLTKDTSAAPTCDGEDMTPGTQCIKYTNGRLTSRSTYQEALEDQRDSHETGIRLLKIGGGLIGGSLAVFIGCGLIGKVVDPDPETPVTPRRPRPPMQARPPRTAPMPTLAPRPAAPQPAAPRPVAERDDFRQLLSMVGGSTATAERLIEYERRRLPAADRATLTVKAIDRLQWDRSR